MSVADLCFGLLVITYFILQLLFSLKVQIPLSASNLNYVCQANALGYSIGCNTSTFIVTHIALTYASAIHRRLRLLGFLNRAILLVWPLGIAVSIVQVIFDHIVWDAQKGCHRLGQADVTFLSLDLTCFVVCLACYLGSLVKMYSETGKAAHARVLGRVHYFILAWLVCCGPNLIRDSSPHNFVQDSPVLHGLAITLFNLSGAANALVYALHSRYIRRMFLRNSREIIPSRGRSEAAAPLEAGSLPPVSFGTVDVMTLTLVSTCSKSTGRDDVSEMPEGGTEGPQDAITKEPSVDDLLLGCFEASRIQWSDDES
jgi:hypothetical protein